VRRLPRRGEEQKELAGEATGEAAGDAVAVLACASSGWAAAGCPGCLDGGWNLEPRLAPGLPACSGRCMASSGGCSTGGGRGSARGFASAQAALPVRKRDLDGLWSKHLGVSSRRQRPLAGGGGRGRSACEAGAMEGAPEEGAALGDLALSSAAPEPD